MNPTKPRRRRKSYLEVWLYRLGRMLGSYPPFYALFFGIQTGMDSTTIKNHEETSRLKAEKAEKVKWKFPG